MSIHWLGLGLSLIAADGYRGKAGVQVLRAGAIGQGDCAVHDGDLALLAGGQDVPCDDSAANTD